MLSGGHTDSYTSSCNAGQFLHASAFQAGVDVAVTILDPAGKPITTSNSPIGRFGLEPASVLCESTGTYTIRVRAFEPDAPEGKYTLRIIPAHVPNKHNLTEMEAERSFFAAVHSLDGTEAEKRQAIVQLDKAIDDWTAVDNKFETGVALYTLGMLTNALGDPQKAVDLYKRALDLEEEASAGRIEADTLDALANAYLALGRPEDALETGRMAERLSLKTKNRRMQAAAYEVIGAVYNVLSKEPMALQFDERALPILQELNDTAEEGALLTRLGNIYNHAENYPKALDYLNQALTFRGSMHRMGVEAALVAIGTTYLRQKDTKKAISYFNQALAIAREIGDRRSEAITLFSIADASHQSNDDPTALRDALAALSLAKAVGDTQLQGRTDFLLLRMLRVQHPQAAILFGFDAVDAFQQVRQNITGLNERLQMHFAASKSPVYRMLAELLARQNRLSEAEHVLDLLKVAEFTETVRDGEDRDASKTAPLPRAPADQNAERQLATQEDAASQLTADSFEYERLNALTNPTPADSIKLAELSKKIATGNAAMETFFNKTLYAELGSDTIANARVNDASSETSSLMNILADLGPDVIALYTLVGDQHSYIIVTTANTRARREIHANTEELSKLVLATRQQLVSPTGSPSADLIRLDHLLLDPIADDIAAASKQSKDGVPTLLWSLDGILRYLPMNALYDGKQYLVERARNVIVTPESRNHLLDPASTKGLTAVALGLSKSYNGADALEGVTAELNAVVHDPAAKDSHGPLSGKLVSNDDFTLAALEDNLHQHYPVVHIASHFAFRYGNAGESYLLLGGDQTGGPGYALTLSQLQTDPQLSFRGTRLLTLSACGTAEAGITSNGREIDSLGMVVQKRDAAAVLATLWSVNDASTSLLMSDFYHRWAAQSGIEKVEALRQSQIAMLRGNTYTHPYFWAPFVLIGNFR
jgi:CHAT domain-containing protein